MQVVCEATQSENESVKVAAFECLVRIMQLYYEKMELYMQKALYGVCLIFIINIILIIISNILFTNLLLLSLSFLIII